LSTVIFTIELAFLSFCHLLTLDDADKFSLSMNLYDVDYPFVGGDLSKKAKERPVTDA